MLFWIIKIIIFSIIFIFLIHNIINFLLETLTISKTKDMIQITNNNYKNIYDILSRQIPENITQDIITPINSLPNSIEENQNDQNNENNNMKNELANYLREELNIS